MGGLLTLAAPIIAVLIHSRMADEIKRQAKQQAEQAVQTAAQAILPRFQQIVDDFSARLADFVTAAGQALVAVFRRCSIALWPNERRKGST